MSDIIIKNAILFTLAGSGAGLTADGAAGIKGNPGSRKEKEDVRGFCGKRKRKAGSAV